MKHAIIIAAFIAPAAHAGCFGSGSSYSCYEDGTTYNVNKMGNMTTVTGSSANGTFNSTSQRFGNTTFQNGTSVDGGTWNQTIQSHPGGSTRYGTDSKGNSFYKTCNAYGCY